MAANLDKAESSLSSVSDVAYLRALDSSGNSVKISKADLASVLGDKLMPIRHLGFTGDCNDIVDWGWYRITSGVTNAPGIGANSWLLCLPHTNPSSYVTQWIFPRGVGDRMYRREKAAGTWSDWAYIYFGLPDFYKDYSDLSSLASALGGLYNFAASDANTITKTGAYLTNNNVSNVPEGWGTIIHIESQYALQMYIGGNNTSSDFYVRKRLGSGEWMSWMHVAITT